MKQLLFLFFALSYCCCTAQDVPRQPTALQLQKEGAKGPVALNIKPNRKIRIKTYDGDRFTFRRHTLVGDSLIVSGPDTVALQEIRVFRGNVKGNFLRKASGVVLISAGGYFALVGAMYGLIGILSGGGPLLVLLPLPAYAVAILGTELAGARRFKTSRKWTISIVDQPEQK